MMNSFSLAFLLAVLMTIDGQITISTTSFETQPSSKTDAPTSILVTQPDITTPILLSTTRTTEYNTITTLPTTPVPSTNASTVSANQMIDSTTPVITNMTPILTNPTSTTLTTSLKTTDVTTATTTTSLETTEMTTTATTTPLVTTEMTSITTITTPVETTMMTTTATTTPLDTTKMASITTITTPVETTEMTTTTNPTPLKTAEMTTTTNPTPLKTTEMTTTTTTTTPLKTTEMTTTTNPTPLKTTVMTTTTTTTPLKTTEMATTTITTPLETTQMTTANTTRIQTTEMSTTPLTTTEITTTASPTELTTQDPQSNPDTTTILGVENTTTPYTSLSTITSPTTRTTTEPVIKWKELSIILRISKPWSPELLLENSNEYSTLKGIIKTNVNYSLSGTVSEVEILKFRPGSIRALGSIIAEISLNTTENKTLDILKAAVQSGSVGKLQVDPSFPLQFTSSANISTNQTNYIRVQGDTLSVNCSSVSTTRPPADIKIMWLLNDLPILENKNNDARIQVKQMKDVGTLTFKNLRLRDNGTLQCLAAGAVSSESVVIFLKVKPLPQVKITTNTPYVESGGNVTLNCSVVNNASANIIFHKIKGFTGRNTTKYSKDQVTLTLFGVKVETTVWCRATSQLGKGEAYMTISVYTPQKKTCPQGNKWPITPSGEKAEILCDPGFSGNIQRYCQNNGIWEAPNKEYCVKKVFENIIKDLIDRKDNIGRDTSDVLEKLANITDEKETNLTAGDMIVSIEALEKVVEITDKQKEVDKAQIDGFFAVANNIITPSRGDKWSAIKKKDEKLGFQLLKKMEDFGSIVANKVSDLSETTISKDNLAVVISKVSTKKKYSFPGKWVQQWVKQAKTTMDLSPNIFNEITPGQTSIAVSVILFRNLSSILPDSNESSNRKKTEAELNTMVMSINVGKGGKTRTQLTNPVQLGFQHINKKPNLVAFCSYWDFNKSDTIGGGWSQEGCEVAKSNSSGTQCNCYHLTNFAVLTSIAPANSKALSIITFIGCGISIGCCLLTIMLYACFWQFMTKTVLAKSKAVLLINMCVAVIMAYTLFLAGIKAATVDKVACTVVAAFLHFFCLSLFSSLLIYAIDMALALYYIFITKFNRLPLMLILTWLFPAIIVAVSLGVTKTEGYGNDNFCWLSVKDGVIWAFLGPIILVIVINTLLFIYIFRKSMSSTTAQNKPDIERIKSGAKALCLTTPIFGITWIIGVFAVNEDTVALQYLFTIINSLQGLFLFLAFCVFCEQFRQAVTRKYNRLMSMKATSRTFPSKSRPTQLSDLKERSMESTYDNDAYEGSLPDYLNLEFMCEDDATEDVTFEFEAIPVRSQPKSRRYLDETARFPVAGQYPGPSYSKTQSSWDNENRRQKEAADRRQFGRKMMTPSPGLPVSPIRFPGKLRSAHDSYMQPIRM